MKYVIGRHLHMIHKWGLKWYLFPGKGVTENIHEAYHYDKQEAEDNIFNLQNLYNRRCYLS